jgi:hypothetical protein
MTGWPSSLQVPEITKSESFAVVMKLPLAGDVIVTTGPVVASFETADEKTAWLLLDPHPVMAKATAIHRGSLIKLFMGWALLQSHNAMFMPASARNKPLFATKSSSRSLQMSKPVSASTHQNGIFGLSVEPLGVYKY